MFDPAQITAAQIQVDARKEKERKAREGVELQDLAQERAAAAEDLKASRADTWYLKPIRFQLGNGLERETKIITQNFNGPCSFIAICNILILRGDIDIQPPERRSVSYEFLSHLIADYLLAHASDVDITAALEVMPLTQKGMDLNPLFTGTTSFRPGGSGGELQLFDKAGIKLVHGWLVDPDSPEAPVVAKHEDYDAAVNLIAEADHLSGGQLLMGDDQVAVGTSPSGSRQNQQAGPSSAGAGSSSAASSSAGPSHSHLDEGKRTQISDAFVMQRFLDSTQSQLTYYGLFTLASTLEGGSLAALFRSSHLSVLYKSHDGVLYSLVTDFVFLHETSVVWERMEDLTGSTFVDSDFVKSSPAGGDIAGHTAQSALAALDAEAAQYAEVDPADEALAKQLQAEEDQRAQQAWADHERRRLARQDQRRVEDEQRQREASERRPKKKTSCIIM